MPKLQGYEKFFTQIGLSIISWHRCINKIGQEFPMFSYFFMLLTISIRESLKSKNMTNLATPIGLYMYAFLGAHV